jgi:hypothetical protein
MWFSDAHGLRPWDAHRLTALAQGAPVEFSASRAIGLMDLPATADADGSFPRRRLARPPFARIAQETHR